MKDESFLVPSAMSGDDLQLVRDQLELLLVSKYFKSAKQMQRFLEYIVERTIAGESRFIKQYTIGVEALGFADDFYPDEDPSVRILGGRVRQRLAEYYDDENNTNELIIDLPKGSYIPKFNKNAVVKTKVNADSTTLVSCGPTLALVSFSDKTQDQYTNSVLFQITDTLATELSRFLLLKLMVCNPFAEKEFSHLAEVEMNFSHKADYILSLYTQKLDDENKYRLIYRLVPVATGEVLWSDNYVISSQPIKEQGLVVGKITAKVADPLQGIMHTHWSRTYLANLDTVPDHHKALVYFRNFTDHLNRESFEIAVNTFLEALERNPNDIVASVLFASACRRDYAANYDVIESPLEKGLKTIESVIRLNPNSHEAHYVHGLILFCMKEWDLCEDAFDRVRSISRYHIVTEFGIGFTLCKMNKWEKGLALAQKAMLLSADYPSFYHIVPFLDFYRQEKYGQALSQAKKITTPATIHGPLARCISYGQLGDIESAEMEFQEILYRYPKFLDQGRDLLTHIFGSETLVDNIWRGVLLVNSNCK